MSVPKGTPGKQLDVVIKEQHLSVGVKGGDPVVSGRLDAPVLPDECCWTLEREDGLVTVQLDKKDKMHWWGSIVEGHERIDTSKVAPGNSKLSDLDGETRTMVEKMMYDQRAKAAGKPTSEEKEKMEMFEKFKKQHPEMDFSNVQK